MITALDSLARIDRLTWLLIAAFLALGGYLLWGRGDAFAATLPSILLWLAILACPLMHLFMHRGHRKDARPGESNPKLLDRN